MGATAIPFAISGNWAAGDIARALEALHEKKGIEYIKAVQEITEMKIFKPVSGSKEIFSALGKSHSDFENILAAAEKMVEKGYRVFILPNPGGTRSGDCTLQKKSFVGLYDVKTIVGKGSIGSRLEESFGGRSYLYKRIKEPKWVPVWFRCHEGTNTAANILIIF